jgi:peptidoglycan/LPS O-acetylase OafA/YrhL
MNLVRALLASAVVLAHTAPLGGFPPGHWAMLSRLSVDGFFVLSGYLVTGSRVRLGSGRYLWHRLLRLLPGFWVCLAVIGFLIAPLGALLGSDRWMPSSAFSFVRDNLGVTINQWGVGETLAKTPYPGVWDGSLWTLSYEVLAYLAVGLLLSSVVARRRARPLLLVVAAAAAVAVLLAAGPLHVTSFFLVEGARLGACFAAGTALWAWRDDVPRSTALTVVAAFVVTGLALSPVPLLDALVPLPLGYLLLSLGASARTAGLPRSDLSYGVYIYAFPIQQLIALVGGHHLGLLGMFVMSMLATLPVAWLSWKLIEAPALRWKGAHVTITATAPFLATGAAAP